MYSLYIMYYLAILHYYTLHYIINNSNWNQDIKKAGNVGRGFYDPMVTCRIVENVLQPFFSLPF